MEWKKRPTHLEIWQNDIDYIVFIDENGSPDLKRVRRLMNKRLNINEEDKFFTVTGCIIAHQDYPTIRDDFLKLKEDYWENGLFYYEKWQEHRRVCFHSCDIRKKTGPFSKTVINYPKFLSDLTNLMKNCSFNIISATVDKENLLSKYPTNPIHPYNLCLGFILERLCKYFLFPQNKKAIILLEARGRKEDHLLLKHTVKILESGTYYVPSCYFSSIEGIYFNAKWCEKANNQKSYLGLELADLCSHPIYKYSIGHGKNYAFKCIENKIYCYPNYMGKGIKIFP